MTTGWEDCEKPTTSTGHWEQYGTPGDTVGDGCLENITHSHAERAVIDTPAQADNGGEGS